MEKPEEPEKAMAEPTGTNRPTRTVLHQLIKERRQTLEEFAAYAETFAREHNEPGTLGVRHLQRLIAGRRPDGGPLGPVRPATARLLEHIFGRDIEELLSPPDSLPESDSSTELRERLQTSMRIDSAVFELLYQQLDSVRRLDRRLGATVAYEEVLVKIEQVKQLLSHSLLSDTRARLAALLSEWYMLAGWQALDRCKTMESWHHYEQAKSAATESQSEAFEAHTSAQQAFVLIDIGRSSEAVTMLAHARIKAVNSSPALLRSWLAAAHGEALAANGKLTDSLRTFDEAAELLPSITSKDDGPYVALDPVHLNRWRGHALARLGASEAVSVLSNALDRLDSSFTRAETALRVDLAIALDSANEQRAAQHQARHATELAKIIGSKRQLRRVQHLIAKG
jgi:tetratricopeptide (TPR) repeat protein